MIALVAISLLWAGMLLGISFLETPVKFRAPSVTLAIGLDVGRHVFGVFNKVELGLTALLAASLAVAHPAAGALWAGCGAVALAVLLQTCWLRPVLDRRVEAILRGETPSKTAHHLQYIALEVCKLVLLLVLAISALRALAAGA